jgi:hypothetical protein
MQSKLFEALAAEFEMDVGEMIAAVKTQCFPNGQASDPQLLMLLSFTHEYGLNPLAREAYAFLQGGRMTIGVQVDGWTKIANRSPLYDGQEIQFEYSPDGELTAITSRTHIKGRTYPTVYRAAMKEWKRETSVWQSMPSHQLYVKARNEGIRFALGIPAYDPDDIDRMRNGMAMELPPPAPAVEFEQTETIADFVPPPREKVKVAVTNGMAPQPEVRSTASESELASFIKDHSVPDKRVKLFLSKKGVTTLNELNLEAQAELLGVLRRSYGVNG